MRSAGGLPVPPEYFGASFQEIMETLRMRLPHPEWGNTPAPEEASHRETNGSRDAAMDASEVPGKESREVSRDTSTDEATPDGGRFSLLEID